MEPPCEHGGVAAVFCRAAQTRYASMEPPCEHGGVRAHKAANGVNYPASMEPPCEHGGVRSMRWEPGPTERRFNGAAV